MIDNIFKQLMREIRISRTQAFNQIAQASNENWKFNESNSGAIDDVVVDSLEAHSEIASLSESVDDIIVSLLTGEVLL